MRANLACYLKITATNQVFGSGGGGGGSGGASGPAGGDLSGSYPGPSVVGLQGTPICVTAPVLGDVLTFDGTDWCPAVPTGGGVTGFATPAIVLGTAAAAGAATTVIRSDSTIAAFTSALPLADGTASAGTAVKASREDHIHPGGRWEVCMTDGITDPPEPVWTVDGTDWVYAFVP